MTSIQKMEAMRAVDGTRDSKSGFGRFLLLGENKIQFAKKINQIE